MIANLTVSKKVILLTLFVVCLYFIFTLIFTIGLLNSRTENELNNLQSTLREQKVENIQSIDSKYYILKVEERRKELQSDNLKMIFYMIIFSIIPLIIAFGLSYLFTGKIFLNIRRTGFLIKDIAEGKGDLGKRLDPGSGDGKTLPVC